jgi:hypothetical protein
MDWGGELADLLPCGSRKRDVEVTLAFEVDRQPDEPNGDIEHDRSRQGGDDDRVDLGADERQETLTSPLRPFARDGPSDGVPPVFVATSART